VTAPACDQEARRAAVLALVACTWLLGMELVGLVEALAYLAPTLMLAVLLALGHFPGEQAVARRLRRAVRRRPRLRSARPRARPARAELPRGGALLGAALAGRAPPLREPTARFERKEPK
jgi:hypothetical protein